MTRRSNFLRAAVLRDGAPPETAPGATLAYLPPCETPSPADPPPRRYRRGLLLVAVDAITLMLAVAANILGADHNAGPASWMLLYVMATMIAIGARGGYRFRLQTSPFEYLGIVVGAPAVVCTLVIAARVGLDSDPDPDAATQLVRLWAFATVYLIAGRIATGLVRQRTTRGRLNTLIVGAGVIGNTLARRLRERPALGLRPVGFIDDEPLLDPRNEAHGLPILGANADLEEIVARHHVEHVILAFSTARHGVTLDVARRCRALGVEVSLVPRLFEEMGRRITVEHVGGIAMLRVDRADPRGWQFECKYAIDRILSIVLLLLAAPLLLVIAAAVRLGSPGPVVFRQRRVGLDGREFDIYKFRTMRDGGDREAAEAEWIARALGIDADGVLKGVEDRRTPVGRLLRRTSLDELPQLLNVARGQMSLVGPRPERPGCADAFGQHVYRYGDRHRVRSGVTGWAQVNGLRGHTSLEDRIEWDNFYIENWSPWLDLKILLLTPAALVGSDDG